MNVAFKEPAQPVRSLDSIAEALLLPTGIDGIYARTAIFEQVVGGLTALISRYCEPNTEVLRFPPVMSRRQVEKSGYLKSFPHFLGCVSCLGGAEADVRSAVERSEAGEDWTPALAAADLVLSPAACYPVYPLVASRGHVPAGGLTFDVACDCFRREPSQNLDRLHELQLSPRPFRHDVESAHRSRRSGPYRLCRFRHRPADVGAVRDPWPRPAALAGRGAQGTGALK